MLFSKIQLRMFKLQIVDISFLDPFATRSVEHKGFFHANFQSNRIISVVWKCNVS